MDAANSGGLGVCSPSRAAVMTSLFPGRLGMHGHFARHDQNARRAMPNWMPTDVPTYMSLLRDIGYYTSKTKIGSWNLQYKGIVIEYPDYHD